MSMIANKLFIRLLRTFLSIVLFFHKGKENNLSTVLFDDCFHILYRLLRLNLKRNMRGRCIMAFFSRLPFWLDSIDLRTENETAMQHDRMPKGMSNLLFLHKWSFGISLSKVYIWRIRHLFLLNIFRTDTFDMVFCLIGSIFIINLEANWKTSDEAQEKRSVE